MEDIIIHDYVIFREVTPLHQILKCFFSPVVDSPGPFLAWTTFLHAEFKMSQLSLQRLCLGVPWFLRIRKRTQRNKRKIQGGPWTNIIAPQTKQGSPSPQKETPLFPDSIMQQPLKRDSEECLDELVLFEVLILREPRSWTSVNLSSPQGWREGHGRTRSNISPVRLKFVLHLQIRQHFFSLSLHLVQAEVHEHSFRE